MGSFRHRVPDVRTGHEIGEDPDDARLGEQLAEHLAQARDVVARREQRRLGLREGDGAVGVRSAFGVIGVQHVDPAREPSRELPPEVDRVLEAQVQPRAAGGEDVRRVADEEHPARPVPLRDAGVAAPEPAQQVWPLASRRLEGNVGTQHPAHAGPHLLQAHGDVDVRPVPLDGGDQRGAPRERRVGETAVGRAGGQERRDGTVTRHGQDAGRRVHPLRRHRGVRRARGGPVVGDTREPDPGGLADGAVRAVGPHEVPGPQFVGTSWTVDGEGDAVVVLDEAGALVPPADVDAQFAGAVLEHAHEVPFRHREGVERAVLHQAQVER